MGLDLLMYKVGHLNLISSGYQNYMLLAAVILLSDKYLFVGKMGNIERNFWHLLYAIYIYLVSGYFVLKQIFTPRFKSSSYFGSPKVAIITGGGHGIGLATTLALLEKGMTVISVGLEDEASKIHALQAIYPNQVHFMKCDLLNLEEVQQVEANFRKLKLPLHLLILNAGVMFAPWKSIKGLERHFLINYLSQFALTHSLLHHMKKSSNPENPGRIVALSSCLHYCGSINFDDLQGRKFYDRHAAYCQSKLAMIMFTNSLNRLLKEENFNIIANSVHPAVVSSKLLRHTLVHKIPWIGKLLLETPEGGCQNVLFAALSKEVTTGGNYYDNGAAVFPSKESQCRKKQEKLWDISCSLLNIQNFGSL